MSKIALLTIQKWGNSLAVRIPAKIAKSVHFHVGTPVEMEAQEDGIIVKQTGEPRLTLAERLELFDPKKHGGEFMATKPVGKEKF